MFRLCQAQGVTSLTTVLERLLNDATPASRTVKPSGLLGDRINELRRQRAHAQKTIADNMASINKLVAFMDEKADRICKFKDILGKVDTELQELSAQVANEGAADGGAVPEGAEPPPAASLVAAVRSATANSAATSSDGVQPWPADVVANYLQSEIFRQGLCVFAQREVQGVPLHAVAPVPVGANESVGPGSSLAPGSGVLHAPGHLAAAPAPEPAEGSMTDGAKRRLEKEDEEPSLTFSGKKVSIHQAAKGSASSIGDGMQGSGEAAPEEPSVPSPSSDVDPRVTMCLQKAQTRFDSAKSGATNVSASDPAVVGNLSEDDDDLFGENYEDIYTGPPSRFGDI